MKRILYIIIGLVAGLAIGYDLTRVDVDESLPPAVAVVHDTIPSIAPQETEVKELPSIAARLPVVSSSQRYTAAPIDTCRVQLYANRVEIDEDSDHPPDSVDVLVPITQKVYEDSTYRAYVSGFNASLDSIFVYRRTEYITNTRVVKSKPKRFSIGVQAGYGITPKGFQPYVGVGVSVNLFNL